MLRKYFTVVRFMKTKPKSPRLVATGKIQLLRRTSTIVCSQLIGPLLLFRYGRSYHFVCINGAPSQPSVERTRVGKGLVRATRSCRSIIQLGNKSPIVFNHLARRLRTYRGTNVHFSVAPKVATTDNATNCDKVSLAREKITASIAFAANELISGRGGAFRRLLGNRAMYLCVNIRTLSHFIRTTLTRKVSTEVPVLVAR